MQYLNDTSGGRDLTKIARPSRRAPTANAAPSSVTLNTVDGALFVLEILGERGRIAVKDVAAELNCSRSSAYRIIRTLQGRGWIAEAQFGTYALGPKAAALGMLAVSRPSLRDVALPLMRKLVARFGETVTLSILVGRERVCIEQVESPKDVRMTIRMGQAYPLYAGATGKAILMMLDPVARAAYLTEVPRRRLAPNTLVERRALERALADAEADGYVVSVAERDPEAYAVAAPILDRNAVAGALALCGPVSRWQKGSAASYGAAVLEAADLISAQLGSTPRSTSR